MRKSVCFLFLTILGIACSNSQKQIQEIDSLLKQERFEEAAKKATEVLEKKPSPELLKISTRAYLKAGLPEEARNAYIKLRQKGEDDPELLSLLAQMLLEEAAQTTEEMRRRDLLETLADVNGAFALAPLLSVAAEGEEETRAQAVRLIGSIPGIEAKEALVGFLLQGTPRLQVTAAAALLRRGEEVAREPLEEALEGKDDDLQIIAARAFAEVGDERGARTAERGIGRKLEVALQAVEALGLMKGKVAVKALQKAFSDSRAQVRAAAARAAGEQGSSEFLPMVRKLLFDPDPLARQAAATALGLLADAEATESLRTVMRDDINGSVRLAAAQALRRLGDELGYEFVFNSVRADTDPEMQALVLRDLGVIGDKTFIKEVRAAASSSDVKVRTAAIFTLGELADREGAALIVEAARDTDTQVRLAAARALSLFDAPNGLDTLLTLLGDSDASVRAQAAVSILVRQAAQEEEEG